MKQLEQFGRRVLELRRELGTTRAQLAAGAGLSPRFLADVETGRGNISLTRFLDLCVALGVPPPILAASLPFPMNSSTGGAPAHSALHNRYASILSMLNSCSSEKLDEIHIWLSRQLAAQEQSVALIGLRGAGKTTIGRKAAARLRWKFVELDELIEQKSGLALQDIFEVHGEEYYRHLEHEVVLEFPKERKQVVMAAGGGIVTRQATFDLLRQNFLIFWLKATPEDHWNRVLKQDPRPMANHPNAFTQLQNLLKQREPLYSQADFTIDTSVLGIAGSVRRIVAQVRAIDD
jgi:XRE family transcriptional regulator, aerobic/anaerobic benzoate catabolism transcriptional regulator